MTHTATPLRAALLPAVEATMAIAVTVAVLALAGVAPGALLLGGVLAMSLSRSRLNATWRGRAEAAIALPVLGLATAGIGLLLATVPVAGATVFTVGMFSSVWLRRFGPVWHRIGGLVALPLVALLITPATVVRDTGVLGVIAVSLVALAAAVGARLITRRPAHTEAAHVARPSTLRPIASTRMAIQLGIAVAVAFAVGFWVFPEHWGWVVLSAYLVCSGNRGRADVAYKSGLRVLGAAGGTLVAFVLQGRVALDGPWLVVFVIVLVAAGLLARAVSYAWWAVVVTVVLALLQSGLGAPTFEFWPRLLAILVGAACGLASSWLILPVRSLDVLRRRVADLLAAMSEVAAGASLQSGIATAATTRLNEVAPPFLALERLRILPAGWRAPAQWVRLAERAASLLPDRRAPSEVRRLIGEARRCVREPSSLTAALENLVSELERE